MIDYSNISKATMRNFFNRITKQISVEKREKEYDDHLDIVRGYLVSLGVSPAYFNMVTVNEAIREQLLKYIKTPGVIFRDDGIYIGTGRSQDKIFGVMKIDEISKLANPPKKEDTPKQSNSEKKGKDSETQNHSQEKSDSSKLDASANDSKTPAATKPDAKLDNIPVVSSILVKPINEILTKGIEEVDIGKKILTNHKYYPYGNVIFLTPELFITKASKKKPKEKAEENDDKNAEPDYRIAMVKLCKYDDHSIAISLINPKYGVKYYFDSMQAGGGKSYKNWNQRKILRRCKDRNVILSEVRNKINKKPLKDSYEDNANPIILSEDSWSSIKRYLSTFVIYYPLYREWIHERFDDPVGLLESIYESQDEEFNSIISKRQKDVEGALKQRDMLQEELNELFKNSLCNICSNRWGVFRDIRLKAFHSTIARIVKSIESTTIRKGKSEDRDIHDILKEDPMCLRNVVLSSESTVLEELSESEEEHHITDVTEEEENFKKSKVAYEEIKKTANDDQDLFDQLAQLLYERHLMIRKVSYITSTESTYDNRLDSINDEIIVLQQAITIIKESAQSVFASTEKRIVDLDRDELRAMLPEEGIEFYKED